MPTFYERSDAMILPEMLRQEFTPDASEVIRIANWDERELGTDKAIALFSAGAALVSAAGILAVSGFTLPIIAPLGVLATAGIKAWNSQVAMRDRQLEQDFLADHPEIVDLAATKIREGQPWGRVAAAVENAYQVWLCGDRPTLTITSAPPTHALPQTSHPQPANYAVTQIEVPETPPWVQQAESTPTVQSRISPDDRAALIACLKTECPALLRLVKSHPIRAVGVQRSGKSTLVKKLALLRMILIPGHRVIAATPHYEPANPYPGQAFTVVGSTQLGRNYAAIEQQWDGLAARVAACRESNITTIWDEFGLFDQVMDEEKIKTNLTSCLRETMKFQEYPIFIVHGETQAFLPGSKGLVTPFLNSTVRVEAIGEPVEDDLGLETIRPTGKFTVRFLDGTEMDGRIPEWLTEEYLLGLIGPVPPAQPVTSSPSQAIAPDPRFDSGEQWSRPAKPKSSTLQPPVPDRRAMPKQEDVAPEGEEVDAGELAMRAEVKRFLATNPDGIKPRDIAARARKPLKGMSTPDIEFLLQVMALDSEITENDGLYYPAG